MNTESMQPGWPRLALLVPALVFLAAGAAVAQVPVDEDGNAIEAIEVTDGISDGAAADADNAPAFTPAELEQLIGPIALYPDDLLAIVLPASTYPLEIVQAARFLEELESDSSLEPDESWDESVVALLNYPEVVEMMNEDLDWTWKLGEAVVAQQSDVIAAIESFRDRAYAAGNLQSDGYQKVERNGDGVIEIRPVEDEIIYVPYYEPERVVVYQPRPVYHYYPQAYPVYYYPYPAHYRFSSGYFWGVTTAFRIGWSSHHLHVFHHSYWGHPYYGRRYFGHFYRQPSISIYNSYYVNHHLRRARYNHRDGDYWRPRRDGGARPGHQRDRTAYFRERRRERSEDGYRHPRRSGDARQIVRNFDGERRANRSAALRDPGTRRENRRESGDAPVREGFAANRDRSRENTNNARRAERSEGDAAIRFRPRQRTAEGMRSTRPRAATPSAQSGTVERRGPPEAARAAASTRTPAARDRARSSSDVRRRTEPPASVSRPRTDASSPSATQRSAPRLAAPPRASAPRSPATQRSTTPRASAPPRSSTPRAAAPRTSASPPRQASRPAPARQSRAPQQRRSGGMGARNGSRTREH